MLRMAEPPKRLSSEQCRLKADECREQARVASKPEHRIMLQHMAETWDRIAADVSDNKQNN
jgi:hypothetical protein